MGQYVDIIHDESWAGMCI